MRLLVIGGGGREHALLWKLSHNFSVEKFFCCPGNAGLAQIGECVDIDATDARALAQFADERQIDLTIVGPEAPLVHGIVDRFLEKGRRIFGPSRDAALLEGSKIFAKRLMDKYGVPTGKAAVFEDFQEAQSYLNKQPLPVVVKADGLAAGKGVSVCASREQAEKALRDCLVDRRFGRAGRRVLIEEYLQGDEVSVLAFCDGQTILPMIPAQDYKRLLNQDEGPNTGGMGAFAPVPSVTPDTYQKIMEAVMEPTFYGINKEGLDYRGVLYAGLILTEDGPKVLEFNVRFGDPEAQAILPLLEGDLAELMLATVERDLHSYELRWSPEKCVTVVVASGGYPNSYETGREVTGLNAVNLLPGVEVFHAGTALDKGRVVTAGGRVLNVTAVGDSFGEARDRAYAAIERLSFEDMYYRTDIGMSVCEVKS